MLLKLGGYNIPDNKKPLFHCIIQDVAELKDFMHKQDADNYDVNQTYI